MTHSLTKVDFEQQVLHSKIPVLVDFWADWCAPCRMLSPIVDEISTAAHIKVCKINVDDEPDLAGEYSVLSVPTLILFKDGREAKRLVGLRTKQEIMALFDL